MARFFTVGWALSLTACTTFRSANSELDNYVGRPVSDVVLKLGAPTTKFDVDNGRRVFEWQNDGACTYTVVATTTNPGSQSLAARKLERGAQKGGCCAAGR